jgi:putative NADH-flavin reductase
MKLLIFGATGKTGFELVNQALEQGHIVTAFARNPEDIMQKHDNLTVVKGDILKYSTIENVIKDHDKVISALGIRTLKKNTIISDGTKNIIRAMEKHNVKRFIVISSIGVRESKQQQKGLGFLYNNFVIPYALKNMFQDKELQEKYIMKSSLDWTIIRPARLTNGKHTKEYRIFSSDDKNIKSKISRADVADYMIKQLTDKLNIWTEPLLLPQ